jgi:hypothetical protein
MAMQAIKPEWASLQAQFIPLRLNVQLSYVVNELEALKCEINAHSDQALSNQSDSLHFMLRKIQRYVEWTVPQLLPDRAEEAEILVNVSRFAAQLLLQTKWNPSSTTTEVEQQIKQVSEIRNTVEQVLTDAQPFKSV